MSVDPLAETLGSRATKISLQCVQKVLEWNNVSLSRLNKFDDSLIGLIDKKETNESAK